MINAQLTPKDWQLLSAYLDGQLNPREHDKLEQGLKKRPELQAALDDLRRMRSVLRATPRRRVPHNFTLTHAMVAEQQVKANPFARWIPALSISSALATLILVVSFLVGTLPGVGPATADQTAGEQPQAMVLEKTAEEAAPSAERSAGSAPPIIVWGGGGFGGGDGSVVGMGGAEGVGGGGAVESAPSLVQPEGGPPPSGVVEEPPAEGAAEMAPPAEGASPDEMPQGTPTPAPEAEQPAIAAAPLEGTGPILGVASEEDQGSVMAAEPESAADLMTVDDRQAAEQNTTRLRMLQGALAVIAIAAGLGALMLFRKSRA